MFLFPKRAYLEEHISINRFAEALFLEQMKIENTRKTEKDLKETLDVLNG